MDEIFFRISRIYDTIHMQANLGCEKSKILIQQTSELFLRNYQLLVDSEKAQLLKSHASEIYLQLLNTLRQVTVYDLSSLTAAIRERSNALDRPSIAVGVVLGFSVGIIMGLKIHGSIPTPKLMKAVVCTGFTGIDRICYVDDIIQPPSPLGDQVLIQVKAACIDTIDFLISSNKIYRSPITRPLILGRGCSGIVIEIGHQVNRVEIGDEVWCVSPPSNSGTISQYVLTSQKFVSKKPSKISFEGAASLAYSGSQGVKFAQNIQKGTVFVENCCTPIGCVLTQILRTREGINLVTSSLQKGDPVAKVMGTGKNIILDNIQSLEGFNFDYVIVTDTILNFGTLLKKGGKIVSTLPRVVPNSNFFTGIFVFIFVRAQYFLQRIFDPDNFGEATFDILYDMVESEQLQPVVDHIYAPQNIEQAIAHKLSGEAIGNTVLKFT